MDKTFYGTEGSRVNVDLPVCTHHAKRQDSGKTPKRIGGAAKYVTRRPSGGSRMCDELARTRDVLDRSVAHSRLLSVYPATDRRMDWTCID